MIEDYRLMGRGAKPDAKDPRDFLKSRASAPLSVPTTYEIANKPPIKNQGQRSSCTGHAAAWVWEQILASRNATTEELSPCYNWYFARAASGYPDQDEGVQIRETMSAMNKWGMCFLKRWGYDRPIGTRPDDETIAYAKVLKLPRYERCITPEDIKYSIAIERQSVVIGIPIFTNWYGKKATQTGIIEMPGESDDSPGWHAMAVCGYDDRFGWFKLANSWGTKWGEDGFCYVPYDALIWGFDAWTASYDALPDATR